MRKRNIFIFTILIIMACSITTFAAVYNEAESNNTTSAADRINIASGNTINGYFSSRDDIDWYKFTLDQGAVIDMTFTSIGSYSEGPGISHLYITDPDRIDTSSYLYEFKYNSNQGCVYSNNRLHLGKGTYYIKLRSDYYSYTYRITINNVDYCESFAEPNNNISQAADLTDGAVTNGIFASYACGSARDNDYFRFYSSSGGKYDITFSNVDVTNYGGTVPTLNCINANGNTVNLFGDYSFIEADTGKSTTRQVTLPAGYSYFYAKTSYDGVGGNGRYSLCIKSVSNNTSAGSVGSGSSSGSTVKKLVLTPPQIKGVKLTKKKPRYVKVAWKAQSGVTGYKIYRSTKKTKGYKLIKTIKAADKKSFIDKKTKRGKRYYYKVRSYRRINGSNVFGKLSSPKSIRR